MLKAAHVTNKISITVNVFSENDKAIKIMVPINIRSIEPLKVKKMFLSKYILFTIL